MDEKPILKIKQSEVTRDTTDIRPKRLLIFEDRVEFKDPSLFKTKTQTVRYEQIAQVSAKLGWLFADFSIENRGGGHIYIKNISKRDAKRAQELINERLRKTGAPVVAESVTEAELVPVAPEFST